MIDQKKLLYNFNKNGFSIISILPNKKIEYLKEFDSTTIAESKDQDHWVKFKYDHVLISKYVPALSYEKGVKVKINNTMVEGVKIKMGDYNKLF